MRKSHPILVGIDTVRPYKLTTSEKLYTIKAPPMQIDQFLPVGGIMGITSYPGVGKTWLAMEIARSISSGTPFLGRYRATRGGVLFVGSDSSLYDYARQWTRLTQGTQSAEEVFEPVRFLVQSTFMFEDRDEIRRLIATHRKFEWGELHQTDRGPEREHGFHTIVMDTVSKLTRANQNDNTEMEDVFRNIRILAEATDAAIILLHHNSKRSEFNDGADWRGAMSQIGALDSWVQLVPSRTKKYIIGVQFKKFRGITPEDFSYQMNVEDPVSASLVYTEQAVTTAQRMKRDALAVAIREFVEQHPGKRACEIRDALWPMFQVGVENGDTTMSFDSKGKFHNSINTHLNGALAAGTLRREANQEGKPLYYAEDVRQSSHTDAPTDAASGTSTTAPARDQSTPTPSALGAGKKAKKSRRPRVSS